MAGSNVSHATKSENREYLLPKEILHLLIAMGQHKAQAPIWKTIIGAIWASFAVSFGGTVAITAAAGLGTSYATLYPGLLKLAFGMTFWVFFAITITYGGELSSCNLFYLLLARIYGRISTLQLLSNWTIVFVFNYIGCGFWAKILGEMTLLFTGAPYLVWLQRFALEKVSQDWGVEVVRGIGANWLICMSIVFVIASQDQFARIVSSFVPTFIYATCGFELNVPNMFFVSLAQMPLYSANNVSLGAFWARNLVPVTIGNFIGVFIASAGLILMNLSDDKKNDTVNDTTLGPGYTTTEDLKNCYDYNDGVLTDPFHVVCKFSKRFVCRDGIVKQVEVGCVVELDDSKKPKGILSRLTLRDGDIATSGVLTFDWKGEGSISKCKITSVDTGLCNLLGYSAEVLCSKLVGEVTYADDENLSTQVVLEALTKHV